MTIPAIATSLPPDRKLLVFTENYARGGSNRYLTDMVNGLRNRFDSVVIASNPQGFYQEDIARLIMPAAAVEVPIQTRARLNFFLRRLPFVVRAVPIVLAKPFELLMLLYNTVLCRSIIKRTAPTHILSVSGGYPGGLGALAMVFAARSCTIPVTLGIVSMPRRRYCPLYEHLFDALVWRCSSRVLVNAQAITNALASKRGLPTKLAHVVHNGLEPRRDALDIGSVRAEGRFTIGCIARMSREKGVLHLFEAFSRLAGTYPGLELLLVGEGPAVPALKRKAAERGIAERVTFTGYVEGPTEELLQKLDLYVFPSLHEGFPYSILEAMRAGSPIVATAVGGIPEAITDGMEGILVDPGSVDALVDAIERCLRSPETCRAFGKNARQRFEKEFTLSAMHARLDILFADGPDDAVRS